MASTSSPRSGSAGGLGAQRPRVCHVPRFSSSAGEEAIELAALAGLELDDWQRFVLLQSLGERLDGKWAAKTVGLVVGRQNGKGSILEARELWGLFLGGERHIIHTAHLQKTATNHFDRVLGLIRNVPEFRKRIASAPRGKGSEAIVLTDGSKIEFMTRARGNTRGLTVDLMVFDEAMYLSEIERNAMVPTMAAQSMTGNTQTWYVGSAVDQEDPAQNGAPFAQVRESGTSGVDAVAFFEWSAPGDDPSRLTEQDAADPEMWALANPGLGIRISREWVEHERTVEMSPRGFAVERLGIGDWPDTSEDAGRVIAQGNWRACAESNEENRVVSDRAFAVDVSPDRTWGSIGGAGRRADELWQFTVVDRRRRTDWVVGRCVELAEEHPGVPFVVLARGPAGNLIEELQGKGLMVVEASGADYGVACSDFFDAVDHASARYPSPQPELDEALAGARKNSGEENAWTWSRKASTSPDISPLVAVTLALWGAMNAEAEFATVLYASDEAPAAADPEIGPAYHRVGVGEPVVLTQEDVTTCFRCATGSHCTEHGQSD